MEISKRDLYDLGISEWDKKQAMLEANEVYTIIEDLKAGVDSDLVALAKLPFPHFAREYLKDYPASAPYFADPAFGYKLYFLSERELSVFTWLIKFPELRHGDFEKLGYKSKPLCDLKNLIRDLKNKALRRSNC